MLTDTAKDLLEKQQDEGRVATGRSLNMDVVITKPESGELLVADYYEYVLRGRKPGRRPPVDPLIEWARAKGFDNPVSMAWAVAFNIAKFGTESVVTNSELEAMMLDAIEGRLPQVTEELAADTLERVFEPFRRPGGWEEA